MIRPMDCDEDGFVLGYMCLTDFEFELGGASGGTVVHPSIDDVKRCRPCVHECGIMEVRVYGSRVVQEPNYPDMD